MPVPLPVPQATPSQAGQGRTHAQAAQSQASKQQALNATDHTAAPASTSHLSNALANNTGFSFYGLPSSQLANRSASNPATSAQSTSVDARDSWHHLTPSTALGQDMASVWQQRNQQLSGEDRSQRSPSRVTSTEDSKQSPASKQAAKTGPAPSPLPDRDSQGPLQTPKKSLSKPTAASAPKSSIPNSAPKPSQATTSSTSKPSVQKPSVSSSAPAYRIPPAIVSSVSTSTKTKASGTPAPPLPPPRKHVLVSHPYLFGNTPDDRVAALRSLGGKAAVSKLFGPGNSRPPPALGLYVRPRILDGIGIAADGAAATGNPGTTNGPATSGIKSPVKGKGAAKGASEEVNSADRPRPSCWSAREDPKSGKEHTQILFKVTVPKATGRKRKRGTEDEFAFVGDGESNRRHAELKSTRRLTEAPMRRKKGETKSQRMRKAMLDNPCRVHAQPLATISDVHSFSCLPDFRYDEDEKHSIIGNIRQKLGGDYDTFEKGGYMFRELVGATGLATVGEKPGLGFAQGTTPFTWGYKESMRTKGKERETGSPQP